jgi:hypothetical protein
MRKLFPFFAALTTVLAACGDRVPRVEDPHKPVVDGRSMRPIEFIQKYCMGSVGNDNATCQQVKSAMAQDAGKPNLPKGW